MIILGLWLELFVLSANAMKRNASSRDVVRRGNNDQAPANTEVNLLLLIPEEVMYQEIVPHSRPSALLSLALTSKSNYGMVTAMIKSFYGDKQDLIYDELVETKADPRFFKLLRRALISLWPTSENCLDRFHLNDALNALLIHTSMFDTLNKKPDRRRTPLPIFFKDKHVDAYHYVPGTQSCAIAVLKHRVYKRVEITSDLVLQAPKDLLLEYRRHMLDFNEAFPFCRKNDPKLAAQLDHIMSLFGHDYEVDEWPKSQVHVLNTLLNEGIDACLDFILQEEFYQWINTDGPILELILEMVEPCHMKKLIEVLKQINAGNFVRLLCSAKKISDDNLLDIFEASRVPCRFSTFLTMIDCGREINENWMRRGKAEVDRILSTYNDDTKRYDVDCPRDPIVKENIWFIAQARNLDDDHLLGLLELFGKGTPDSLFFLSLQLGKSEAVIEALFERLHKWNFELLNDPPRNITIPVRFITRPCFIGCDLIKLIPDESKLIEALKEINKNGLWTDTLNLGSMLAFEIKEPRKNVLQCIMDIAAENNFYSIAMQSIDTNNNFKGSCVVIEYLMTVPTDKLINALSGDRINVHWHTILHMIIRVLLTRPDGFVQLMEHENIEFPWIIEELVSLAWYARFPDKECPLENEYYFVEYFFDFIEDYSNEKVELKMFLYYFAMRILNMMAQGSINVYIPCFLNSKQREIALEVFQTSLKVIDLEDLTELATSVDDPVMNSLVHEEISNRT